MLGKSVALVLAFLPVAPGFTQPSIAVDLATVSTDQGLLRVYGSSGRGNRGVPVAVGPDVDGDGFPDLALAAMVASPGGRNGAGEVHLVFGDGTVSGALDSGQPGAHLLSIHGAQVGEHAGSEIWMDDIDHDGLGDLLICRQDYDALGRSNAGALTVIFGSAALRTQAISTTPLDLAAIPATIDSFTLIGANAGDRLCIWARTGDVDGDGGVDVLVGADQEDSNGETDAGAMYLLRGGPGLRNRSVDLADFSGPTPPLAGRLLRVEPPTGSSGYHLGATVQLFDLDDDGRSELLGAAALSRSGAGLAGGTPVGGAPRGILYILWDEAIPAPPWAAGLTLSLADTGLPVTAIQGGGVNDAFGEEMLGGLDYDDDGEPDLFVGDLTADPLGRNNGGSGHLFFSAPGLRAHRYLNLDNLPPGVEVVDFFGPELGAIAGDTAMHGDFDNDGIADIAFSSPHAAPLGRSDAGTLHVVFGQPRPWPTPVDLRPGNLPDPATLKLGEFYGANGGGVGDIGDTLAYSGASIDLDGDGYVDIVTNEMLGNAPTLTDVGNLIVLSGRLLAPLNTQLRTDGFE